MARSTSYTSLARPDLILTEYGFHIHYMEKGPPETLVKFLSGSNGRFKRYVALSNRYSCLARPDFLHTEYRFHIHYLEKCLRKLRQNFDRDLTIGLKVMSRLTYYSCLARPDLLINEYWFHIHYMEKGL
jgi:hypothetical protein